MREGTFRDDLYFRLNVVTINVPPFDEKVAHLERAFVVAALARAGGIQAAAARLLGVTERSVWHLVKKHRIEVSRLKRMG